jgi:hypothetical protein
VLRQAPNRRRLASWEDAAKNAVENLKPESCLEVKPGDPTEIGRIKQFGMFVEVNPMVNK